MLLLAVDGLTDCVDPDCCLQPSCQTGSLCQGSPDPLELVQSSLTPFPSLLSRPFYDRIHFLLGQDSTPACPADVPFDSRSDQALPPQVPHCTAIIPFV